jgi:methylglutaconyl-CoA hydratase
MNELVTIERDCGGAAGVVEITLRRPEARNALSLDLALQLEAAVAAVAADRDARVLILAGEGKAFCAGMDLRGVLHDAATMGKMLHALARVSLALRTLAVPAIARAHGAAIGGGCGLVVACDFAFTHADAKLGYPEVDLGVCPAVVAPLLVSRLGAGRARALLLAGGLLDGAEALRLGVVTHLAPADELASATRAFAAKLASGGPAAMSATKRCLHELDGLVTEPILTAAADLSARIIAGPEAQERLRARFASTPR